MNVYSIVVHPTPKKSLNGTLFDVANQYFMSLGHNVHTLELFSIADNLFEAANRVYVKDLSPREQEDRRSTYLFNWGNGIEHSDLTLQHEIQKIKESQLIYIQTPIWMYSMPAILKSYFEQIFVPGEFFEIINPAYPSFEINRLQKGKRVILSLTLGGGPEMVSFVTDGIDNLIKPFEIILSRFIGFTLFEPHITWSTTGHPQDCWITDFKQYLETQHQKGVF